MTNYFFTLGWEGNGDDGEVTFSRGTYQQMLDGITENLANYKYRDAFLVCCSAESGKEAVNLTIKAKNDLNIGD